MNPGEMIFIFLIALLSSIFELSGAILHIWRLGKSKSTLEKIRKQYTLIQRIALKHVRDNKACKYFPATLQKLFVALRIYMIVSAVTLVLLVILLLLGPEHYNAALFWGIKLRAYIFDIPIAVWSFFMTKHDKKHGGCTWRWEEENK